VSGCAKRKLAARRKRSSILKNLAATSRGPLFTRCRRLLKRPEFNSSQRTVGDRASGSKHKVTICPRRIFGAVGAAVGSVELFRFALAKVRRRASPAKHSNVLPGSAPSRKTSAVKSRGAPSTSLAKKPSPASTWQCGNDR
jgi:hypothetical protein